MSRSIEVTADKTIHFALERGERLRSRMPILLAQESIEVLGAYQFVG